MQLFRPMGHVLGGALLIAGTTIGVGMLALPVATGPAGSPAFRVNLYPDMAVHALHRPSHARSVRLDAKRFQPHHHGYAPFRKYR